MRIGILSRPFLTFSSHPALTFHSRVACRAFSTVLDGNPRKYRIPVPVGGSGVVELDVFEPVHKLAESHKDILIYFPPGPSLPFHSAAPPPLVPPSTHSLPALLPSILPTTTIITLNYRIGTYPSSFAFPHPIHDVFTAFDHITTPTARQFNALSGPGSSPVPEALRRISLLGSHIGGTLAASLALTEPSSIHALAIYEPILDWISPDDHLGTASHSTTTTSRTTEPKEAPSKLKSKSTAPTIDPSPLLRLRTSLFPNPSTYFDPFVSPILFLRAAGRDCPNSDFFDVTNSTSPFSASRFLSDSLPSDPLNSATFGPYDDDIDIHQHDHWHENPSDPPPTCRSRSPTPFLPTDCLPVPVKRRKVMRRWPHTCLPPKTRMFIPTNTEGGGDVASILRAQSEEFGDLLKRVGFAKHQEDLTEGWVGIERVKAGGRGENSWIEQAGKWLAETMRRDGK